MHECFVSFTSTEDIREFVSIATRQRFAIRVEAGQMQTSGESILGLFCMGINKPLRVLFPAEADAGQFMLDLRPYLVS